MCNIIVLSPGQMPVKTEFWNMVYNNWHSYGLLVRTDTLELVKAVPEKEDGEIDPLEVWNLIDQHKDHTRFLHVRHITAGDNSLENCHPLQVADEADYQVYFMHNGTMDSYKSKIYVNNKMEDDNSGPSDTRNYADWNLIPYFDLMGTYEDTRVLDLPITKKVMNNLWPYNNRGLLVCSDGSVLFMGNWEKRKAQDGTEYPTSNLHYFEKVVRGPEFERRKAEEAKKPTTEKKSTLPIGVADITKYDYRQPKASSQYRVTESFRELFNEIEFYDRSGLSTLGYCTVDELNSIYDLGKIDCVQIMDCALTDYAVLNKEYEELKTKHEKASAMIAGLQAKLRGDKKAA